ncbi:hypothetical protein JCM19239_2505 [Vibrio variabilis]|uniref:Uncharacterized protein n=1 Tax=Vibrio variabilis TaxID=990271 RepID=A0ABQ0JFP4_9VIBR|nr:hypothetical protein JCM19239_2505 [Vibrio variabilis]
MIKIAVTFLLTVTLCLAGFVLYQSNMLSMQMISGWFSSEEPVDTPIEQVEVQVDNVLVPSTLAIDKAYCCSMSLCLHLVAMRAS